MDAGSLLDAKTYLLGAAVLLASSAAACGDSAAETEGAKILPHQSPASFGEMYPLGDNDPDPTGNVRTPFEWVLLLQSQGDEALEITEVCLVGEDENGSDVDQFTLEVENQELPATVAPGEDFGLRLTYDRQEPNAEGDSDQVAVVVQSNATDYPTLIVPVCARVIADGEEKSAVECDSPVQVEAGERAADLCG